MGGFIFKGLLWESWAGALKTPYVSTGVVREWPGPGPTGPPPEADGDMHRDPFFWRLLSDVQAAPASCM